jgi:hypothetical protein
LLDLEGMASHALLDDVEISAGKYKQIRLSVNAEHDSVMVSYIVRDVADETELEVPGGSHRV